MCPPQPPHSLGHFGHFRQLLHPDSPFSSSVKWGQWQLVQHSVQPCRENAMVVIFLLLSCCSEGSREPLKAFE